mmetsp:Transcript_21044/g.36119  ORF Transcript_21044/g.36119 Transcript_21044/m.36119 type:complete len:163 (-) Transcript_21044:726-1214(-)
MFFACHTVFPSQKRIRFASFQICCAVNKQPPPDLPDVQFQFVESVRKAYETAEGPAKELCFQHLKELHEQTLLYQLRQKQAEASARKAEASARKAEASARIVEASARKAEAMAARKSEEAKKSLGYKFASLFSGEGQQSPRRHYTRKSAGPGVNPNAISGCE